VVSEPTPTAARAPQGTRSRRRARWIQTGWILLIAVLAFSAAELGLRLTRARPDESETFDLFVVGGSAITGGPYTGISPARLAAAMFDGELAYRPLRVHELAAPAQSTYQQYVALWRAVVGRDASRPGAVVIQCGDEEWLPGFRTSRQDSRLDVSLEATPLARSLLITELLRGARDLLGAPPPRSLRSFEIYLRGLIRVARSAGLVPIIVTTPSNVGGVEPNVPREMTFPQRALDTGLALEAAGEYGPARRQYRLAMRTYRAFAATFVYRIGHTHLAEEAPYRAREAFWEAADLDPQTRFSRVTRPLNAAARLTARLEGAPLVDAVEILEQASPTGVIGPELMLDVRHLNLRAMRLLADALAATLSERFGTPIRAPVSSDLEALERAGEAPEARARAWRVASYGLLLLSTGHPWPHDRLELARRNLERIFDVSPDDFTAWFGIGVVEAHLASGLLADPEIMRALWDDGVFELEPYCPVQGGLARWMEVLREAGTSEDVLLLIEEAAEITGCGAPPGAPHLEAPTEPSEAHDTPAPADASAPVGDEPETSEPALGDPDPGEPDAREPEIIPPPAADASGRTAPEEGRDAAVEAPQ
jgi:hypothetical protein